MNDRKAIKRDLDRLAAAARRYLVSQEYPDRGDEARCRFELREVLRELEGTEPRFGIHGARVA